ncbi:MAG TPA: DMT family transporter [Chlamydiales bacterium]|nr:DMT family transporter [Chlamydiales bacterium]
MAFILPMLLYFLWCSSFPLAKITMMHASPFFLVGMRMLLASFILWVIYYFKNKKSLNISKKLIIPLFLLGLFSVYLTNIFEYLGLQKLSSAKTSFIYSLSPIFSCLLSYVHFKEKMTKRKWLGIAIGLIGIQVALIHEHGFSNFRNIFSHFSIGEIYVALAAFFSVYGWILLRLLVKDGHVSPPIASLYSMFIGGLLALIQSYTMESWNPTPVFHGHFTGFATSILIMTFISNILCYNFYGYLLKRYTATFLSFIGLLCPIFTSIIGNILLNEPFSYSIIISTFIILIGGYFIYQEELKLGYLVKKA